MYRYRNLLHEDNIVLFSPNPLFNSYVSNVLPELGEANMRQTTFLKYIMKKVDEDLTIETPFEQMEYVLTAPKDDNYDRKIKCIEYKSSFQFKHLIDDFIRSLEERGMVFKDIIFQEKVLISKEEIYQYFYHLDYSTSLSNSLALVSEWLLKEIQKHQRNEFDKD